MADRVTHDRCKSFVYTRHLADTTEGFFSRWLVVPFTGFYPAGVADTGMIDRLTRQSELQGLLRQAVGALQQVMRRGSFTVPASVRRATQQFRTEADPLRAYIDERVRPDRNNKVPRHDVYTDYVGWSAENGFSQMATARFYEQFISAATDTFGYPITTTRRSDNRYLTGIALKQDH